MAPVVLLKQVEQESQTPATDSYIEVGRNLHGFDTGYANNIFPRRHKLILDARLHGHDSEMVVRDEVGVTVIFAKAKIQYFCRSLRSYESSTCGVTIVSSRAGLFGSPAIIMAVD